MNVLFLNPPFKVEFGKFSRTSRSPAITKSGTNYYPFWLAYAAGVLEQERKFNVKLIDACADRLTLDKVFEKLGDFIPDLIVLDTSTPSIYNDVEVASKLKDKFSNSFVILVGTHVSALPEESLKLSKKIDAIAKGEYEYTIKDLAYVLLNKTSLKKVKGIIFRSNKIICNQDRELIKDVDKLPFVSKIYKKHLNIRNYFFGAAQYPMIMMITGRGCAFGCKFCVYPQTFHSRFYRPRSPENVVAELEYIKKELPFVKEIGIEDDTFTIDKKRVRKICDLIIQKNLKIKWYANVRADLDYLTMKKMKQAGCRLITVGFESGDQRILNNMAKGITVEQIKEFVKNSKKAGMLVHAAWMVGNIGETKETMKKTLELAKKLNTDMAQFFPIMVYPGTEMYSWAKKKNYLTTEDYSKWLTKDGQYDCVLTTDKLTKTDLFDFCDRALKEYYLRPKYILMKIKQDILNPGEIYRNLRSALQLFRNIKWS